MEGHEIENTVANTVNEHLKLSPPLQTREIDRTHGIGRRITEGRPRSVIVRFTTDQHRDATYKALVNIKARNAASLSRDRIYINDDLTKHRPELLYQNEERGTYFRLLDIQRNHIVQRYNHDSAPGEIKTRRLLQAARKRNRAGLRLPLS